MGLKVARFVLKIVGFSLALAAVVCCVVAYWDKITSAVSGLKDKVGDNRPPRPGAFHCPGV